jgi:hypothetical protein
MHSSLLLLLLLLQVPPRQQLPGPWLCTLACRPQSTAVVAAAAPCISPTATLQAYWHCCKQTAPPHPLLLLLVLGRQPVLPAAKQGDEGTRVGIGRPALLHQVVVLHVSGPGLSLLLLLLLLFPQTYHLQLCAALLLLVLLLLLLLLLLGLGLVPLPAAPVSAAAAA